MSKPKITFLEQNPVDFYNLNHLNDSILILTQTSKVLKYDVTNSIFYEEYNVNDKKDVFKVEYGYFKVISDNSLGLLKGVDYSPFQILVRFKFKNNFTAAFYHIGISHLGMTFPFIRVGVKYFKVIKKTDRFGIEREKLIVWNKDEIKQDFGTDFLINVNKYDDFVVEPSNNNYQKVVGGHYNLYAPFPHKEREFNIADDCDKKILWSLKMLRHIFGEQLEQGLIYLKVMYENPKQALPILVPVSETRSTGKSTLVDWLSIIFGENMVIINPQDISSSFNSSFATKNIIAIEESRFESVQATEKLKALSTQKTLSVNTKFVPPYDTPFYGKIIITSNDESRFSKVDTAEIRYWVRRVGEIPEGMANHNILSDLTKEIPEFLYYLSQLDEVDYTKSRQVFTTQEIATDALSIVKQESKPEAQKEIEMLLEEYCENNPDKELLLFTASDIKDTWFAKDNRYGRSYIRQIFIKNMKLEGGDKSKKYTYFLNEDYQKKSGRPFMFTNKFYTGQLEAIVDTKNDVPF